MSGHIPNAAALPAGSQPASAPRPGVTVLRLTVMAVASVALLLLVDLARPFRRLRLAMTHDGRTYSLLETRQDDATSISGDGVAAALRKRRQPAPGTNTVVMFGNSQLMAAAHPIDGSADPSSAIQGAPARLDALLQLRDPGHYRVYNASVPSQNLPEVLWQAVQWLRVDPTPPAAIIVQASYDTFRKSGIRAGFLSMLDDDGFDRELDAVVQKRPAPFAGEFAIARSTHGTRARKGSDSLGTEAPTSREPRAERFLRRALEALPPYAHRQEAKSDFLEDLYILRVFLLHMSPSGRRHITGAPYTSNMEALRATLRLAREAGTKALVYNAPMDPATKIYFDDEYARYLIDVQMVVRDEEATFVDLAAAVPTNDFGIWLDGPDPIHLQEAGHARLAEQLFDSLRALLGY